MDTITAIATAKGMGAIAIIRLSGERAIEITDKIFVAKNKKLSKEKANTIHYGTICNAEEIVDDVLVSLFKAPRSYTGEDSVEISCHGSVHIQQKILELLINKGARLATPGEFTQRAFLNSKLDLSQAEAVADLIASSSAASHKVALQQMRGGVSVELQNLRLRLLNFISLIELELDFSEEDVQFADRTQLKNLIFDIEKHISSLRNSFRLGNAIKNGIPVAIVGEPNVGKSTLLNVLLKEEKAIVSEIAGTTRDSIEDVINIEGIAFRFIDTAGLRETTDRIESLGIERTYKKIELAEVVLYLLDAENIENSEVNIKMFVDKYPDKKWVFVVNKIDIKPPSPLRGGENTNDLLKGGVDSFITYLLSDGKNTNYPLKGGEAWGFPVVKISAKNGLFIDGLVRVLLDTVNFEKLDESQTIITNVRHFEALTRAYESTRRVIVGIENNISSDFLSQDIREIMHFLGEISGEFSNDEILENIFKNFCIGK